MIPKEERVAQEATARERRARRLFEEGKSAREIGAAIGHSETYTRIFLANLGLEERRRTTRPAAAMQPVTPAPIAHYETPTLTARVEDVTGETTGEEPSEQQERKRRIPRLARGGKGTPEYEQRNLILEKLVGDETQLPAIAEALEVTARQARYLLRSHGFLQTYRAYTATSRREHDTFVSRVIEKLPESERTVEKVSAAFDLPQSKAQWLLNGNGHAKGEAETPQERHARLWAQRQQTLERLVFDGPSLQKIGAEFGISRERARQIMDDNPELESLRREARQERLKKNEAKRRREAAVALIGHLKGVALRKAYVQGWAHGKAEEYIFQRKAQSDNIPYEKLVALFQAYKDARDAKDFLKKHHVPEGAERTPDAKKLELLIPFQDGPRATPTYHAFAIARADAEGQRRLRTSAVRLKAASYKELGATIGIDSSGAKCIFDRVGLPSLNWSFDHGKVHGVPHESIHAAYAAGLGIADIAHFLEANYGDISRLLEKTERRRGIKQFGLERRGAELLTHHLASDIYEAQDIGFSAEEIGQLFDKSERLVAYALAERERLAPVIVAGLRALHPERDITTPYLRKQATGS